ncbi:MAG: putative DNA modification/repair radical SAM protein [Eubacteriales bacterium]|nr:putative DNA modification/repair radical SAM protein [Eubacteriales bacterium]MDD4682230.1 putative DNA modification/repair radical SAM protein [Eubacteriales bacterium]
MLTSDKLSILGESARYDVSCSSSGSTRSGSNGLGSTQASGICHTWTDDGRCVSLLKVLLTNHCEFDCLYCINRRSNDHKRAMFEPEELADLTMEFYRRNMIEGLFLSSGVWRSPDQTMERMIKTIRILRVKYKFHGYIHAKAIPGATSDLIRQMGLLADRVSVNIEQATERGLKTLAPDKNSLALSQPMKLLRDGSQEYAEVSLRNRQKFAPAGQSTQIIIGASPETDYQILRMSQHLYDNYQLKRVYYSAYIPINDNPMLPAIWSAPPLLREHRLYQADWLMRFYKFSSNEIINPAEPDLDLEIDPKCQWALKHLDQFPVDVNNASYDQLLRVPGIGVTSARRIIAARRSHSLQPENLSRIGLVMKRAAWFITCSGKYLAPFTPAADKLRLLLADKAGKKHQDLKQISLEEIYYDTAN